jgi:acyl-CoA carboxylase subunit beta
MGAQQLADVTFMVSRASALAQGKPFDADAAQVVRQAIERQISAEAMPAVLSGLVYDDGIIDPRDTRDVLGIALSAIHTAPVRGTGAFGVFRM